MSKGAINFSSDDDYYTPKNLVAFFGQFDYDPATTSEKAAEFGIQNFDTIETDGLSADWSPYRKIWINPPFTIKHRFLEKAVQYQDGREIYMLIPIAFLTTKRFHSLARGGKIYLPNGRVKFERGLGKPSRSPAFGSVIIKLQDEWELEPLDLAKLEDA